MTRRISTSGHNVSLVQQSCVTIEEIQISGQDEPTEWLHRNDSYVPRSRPVYNLHSVAPHNDYLQRKRERYQSMEQDKKEQLLQHQREYKKFRAGSQNMNQSPNSRSMADDIDGEPSPELTMGTGKQSL